MKKGFTIIEVVLVMGIIAMITSIGCISYKCYKSYMNTVDSKFYCNAIVNFLNYSKAYCRENRCESNITFDIIRNKIKFEVNNNILELPSSIKLKSMTSRNNKTQIFINKYGFSNDAFTLNLEDSNGEGHSITMRVGTSYVKNKN